MNTSHGNGLHIIRDPRPVSDASDPPTFALYTLGGRTALRYRLKDTGRRLIVLEPLAAVVGPSPGAEAASECPTAAKLYGRVVDCPYDLPDHAPERLQRLGEVMQDEEPAVGDELPAAYTYLGQFLAHEVTRFRNQGDGCGPVNWRTPAIDLDSLVWTDLPTPPYAQGVHERAGTAVGRTTGEPGRLEDLPRAEDGAPVLPDPRNDSNLAVAQFTVAVTKLHQVLAAAMPHLPLEAKKLLTARHIQSIVLHDYLLELVQRDVYDEVMARGRCLVWPDGPSGIDPFLVPIEFAAACFRFGHSAVRGFYRINATLGDHVSERLLEYTHVGGAIRGEPARQFDNWTIDWAGLLGGASPQTASPIAANLAPALRDLSGLLVDGGEIDDLNSRNAGLDYRKARINLAAHTLLRGAAVELPSAQTLLNHVDCRLGSSRTRPGRLTDIQIADVAGAELQACLTDGRGPQRFVEQTPLWFYVLREADAFHGGRRLGPLASRIVMETLHAAVQAAKDSIIGDGGAISFTADPCLGCADPSRFTLADLIRVARDVWQPI
jgi:hypothetical protein